MMKLGTGLWAFGGVADRFNPGGYKPSLSLEQQFRLAAQAEFVKGVEMHYPTDFNEENVKEVQGLLDRFGFELPTVCLNFFTHPKWQNGSLTSRNAEIRREALATTRGAVDIARKMGVPACTVWLGQDGHDYLFNDYDKAWDWITQGFGEIADYAKGLTVFMEYKQKEPRTHVMNANVAKALYIVDEVKAKNLGVVIDVGHAFMSDENLAESVAIVNRRGVPFTMHFNDAYGYWDDDMIAGSINLWKYVELFYQLRKARYKGWYDLDIFPYREDAIQAVEQSLRFIDYVKRRVDKNYGEIGAAIAEGDVHSVIDTTRKIFLKAYGQ
jgi:xylose isomerase